MKANDDCSPCEDNYVCNSRPWDCECNKACKIERYFDIKNCSCEKHLIGKLVLESENEILNATETLVNN